jgi:hypothetical protein
MIKVFFTYKTIKERDDVFKIMNCDNFKMVKIKMLKITSKVATHNLIFKQKFV